MSHVTHRNVRRTAAATRGLVRRGLIGAAAALLWPGLAWAQLSNTCPSNTAIVSQITICVVPEQRPVGGCGPCIPAGGDPNVCPAASGAGKCCSNLSEAVFIAKPGDTIGVFDMVDELEIATAEPAVKGAADVGPNVIIDNGGGGYSGPFGSPFRSNTLPPNPLKPPGGLRIEECHNAKITAGDPLRPVIDIQPGAGNILINGLDVTGGSAGIRVGNSGTAKVAGTVLKAIRAAGNTADPVDLTELFNAGLVLTPSTSLAGFPPELGVDGDLLTSWFSDVGNTCTLGACPSFEITFPQDVTVTELQMFGNRGFPDGFDFLAGRFELLSASGGVLFDSGVVDLPLPDRDVTLAVNNVAQVRRVRFTATADEGVVAGFAELTVSGFAFGSGAGIEVVGSFNEVSGSLAESNDIGFFVSGNSNLIRSGRAIGNRADGFFVGGNSNDVRGNEANNNGESGFEVTGSGNMLRSNQSNRSVQGGAKENGGCEYEFANSTTQDIGGNKKDNKNFVGTIASSPKRYAQGCDE